MTVSEQASAFDVASEHRDLLLDVAASAIRKVLEGGRPTAPQPDEYPDELRRPSATFVTLEQSDERLLGCIGTMEPIYPLVVDVAKNSLMAAFADTRTSGVGHREYPAMSIKISVLSPLEPVHVTSFDELREAVRPGIDGLLLDAGAHHSTLLPSVWPKVPETDEFLRILWMKAGLEPGQWSLETHIQRYTTVEFGDAGPREPIAR